MDARFVPLVRPSGLLYARSQFKRGGGFYSRILNLLDRELKHLGAIDVTIQAGYRAEDIRLDGWPRSSARPEHPGVILQFRRGVKGDLHTFRAVRFGSYEENLYAIAMSLEALRAVDRYGVVNGEQYTGFKRIAPPAAPPDGREAKMAAVRNLAENGATEHERAAARAALERLERGA